MADPYEGVEEKHIYTWPNDAFPFRCYLDHPKLRIFILENVSHNYEWLKSHKDYIRDTDFFFVQLGWNFSAHLALHARFTIDSLGLNKDNFYIMYNDSHEESHGHHRELKGEIINHNAWLNENSFKILDINKKYDAVYTARQSSFKRHHLAAQIPNLALVAGGTTFGGPLSDLPPCINDPFKKLNKEEMVEIINQSHCGLCLSEEEGACYSSSEYLLCGVPVVSTGSDGGRDVWYTSDNSLICVDSIEAVKEAATKMKEGSYNRERIRRDHIRMMSLFRFKFINQVNKLLKKSNIHDIDSVQYFHEDFMETHKHHRQYVHCSSLDQVASFFR